MGIKISNMTETGSAPTDSYVPLAFEGENYKVPAGTLVESGEISFRANLNGADQTVTKGAGTGATTLVSFTNTVFNVGNAFDTSAYRFTPGVAGRYFLQVRAGFTLASSSRSGWVYIRKNGSMISWDSLREEGSTPIRGENGGVTNILSTQIVAEANSTDYFDVLVGHNEGSYSYSTAPLKGGVTDTFFAGFKI